MSQSKLFIIKMFKIRLVLSGFLLLLTLVAYSSANAITPTGSDNRIKTFIYGKNDVFKIVTTYGYQTLIELEEDEKILTMSLGDPSPFKLTPQKNKIFLKALIEGQLTNMTLITNKRTYQIELSSIIDDISQIMYVVRFFYPDSIKKADKDSDSSSKEKVIDGAFTLPKIKLQRSGQNLQNQSGEQHYAGIQAEQAASRERNNYNYLKNGKSSKLLESVYDDGNKTYIKIKSGIVTSINHLSTSNKEKALNFVMNDNNSYIVENVYDRITIRLQNGGIICLYKQE